MTLHSDKKRPMIFNKGLMHAMIGLGILALVAKLNDWDESAIFFDGSSLGQSPTSYLIYALVLKNVPSYSSLRDWCHHLFIGHDCRLANHRSPY